METGGPVNKGVQPVLPTSARLRDLLVQALPHGRISQMGERALREELSAVPPHQRPAVEEGWRRLVWSDRIFHGLFGAVWTDEQQRDATLTWIRAHASALQHAPGIVTLLAGSPDGHVREAAVRLLAGNDTRLATATLLLRSSDWVTPVRDASRVALHARLTAPYVAHWLHTVTLVDRLLLLERGDSTLAQGAHDLMTSPVGIQALPGVLEAGHPVTRAALLTVILRLPEEQRTDPLDLFLADPSAVVRRRVAAVLPSDRLEPILTDVDAGVRETALGRLLNDTPLDVVPGVLLRALLDSRVAVRLLAQYEAKRRGVDVAAYYAGVEETVLDAGGMAGWAAGVQERKVVSALPRIERLLRHPRARVRLEALVAVGTLAPQVHSAALERAVLGSTLEARAAARLLTRYDLLTAERLEALWGWAADGQRTRLIWLASTLPRFEAVALLLEWRHGTVERRDAFDSALRRLLLGTTFYTRPEAGQAAMMRAAVAGGTLPEDLRAALDPLLIPRSR